MTKKVRIIVACGCGVATSTLAAQDVKAIAEELGIPFSIDKTSMTELSSKVAQADLILTTNNYKGDLGKPQMNVMGFVTGLKKDQLKASLKEKLIELAKD